MIYIVETSCINLYAHKWWKTSDCTELIDMLAAVNNICSLLDSARCAYVDLMLWLLLQRLIRNSISERKFENFGELIKNFFPSRSSHNLTLEWQCNFLRLPSYFLELCRCFLKNIFYCFSVNSSNWTEVQFCMWINYRKVYFIHWLGGNVNVSKWETT